MSLGFLGWSCVEREGFLLIGFFMFLMAQSTLSCLMVNMSTRFFFPFITLNIANVVVSLL